jgi:protein gp37
MSQGTSIEWTHAPGYRGETWNPVTGCQKISPGCKNCYAEGVAVRFWGERNFTDVRCHEDRLDQPLHWRAPRMVFVNSMSDLFHESVPDGFIAQIFQTMRQARQHIYLVLTKRPERMHTFMASCRPWEGWVTHNSNRPLGYGGDGIIVGTIENWPPRNIWLGVSVESDPYVGRIDQLLETPAFVRFVSYEPALGPVDFTRFFHCRNCKWDPPEETFGKTCCRCRRVDWVIVGGESGPDARPLNLAWAEAVRNQCRLADVPFFMKQSGTNPFLILDEGLKSLATRGKGGNPAEWPEHLRVREWPRGFFEGVPV